MSDARATKAGRGMLGLAVAGLLVAGVGGCSGSGSAGDGGSASCAGPVLTITPADVPVGGSVTVHGQYYLNGCADTSENGKPSETAAPMTSVPLTLSTSAGESQELGTLDATGELGRIDASVALPKEVRPGTVTLRLGDAEPVTVMVTS